MCLYYFFWLNTTCFVASTYFSHSRSHQWPLNLFLQLSAILPIPSCKRKGGGQRFTCPLIQSMPLPPSPLGGCCPAMIWFSTIFSIVHSKGVAWSTRLTLCFGWIPLVLRMDRIEVGRSLKSPLWQIRKKALNQGSSRSREEDRDLGVIWCLDNRREKGTTCVSGSSLWEYGGPSHWERERLNTRGLGRVWLWPIESKMFPLRWKPTVSFSWTWGSEFLTWTTSRESLPS